MGLEDLFQGSGQQTPPQGQTQSAQPATSDAIGQAQGQPPQNAAPEQQASPQGQPAQFQGQPQAVPNFAAGAPQPSQQPAQTVAAQQTSPQPAQATEMFSQGVQMPGPPGSAPNAASAGGMATGPGNPPQGFGNPTPTSPAPSFGGGAAPAANQFMQEHGLGDPIQRELERFRGQDNQTTRIALILPKYWVIKKHYDETARKSILYIPGVTDKFYGPPSDYYAFMIAQIPCDPATGQVYQGARIAVKVLMVGFGTAKTFASMAIDSSNPDNPRLKPFDTFVFCRNSQYQNYEFSAASDSYLQQMSQSDPNAFKELYGKAEGLVDKVPGVAGMAFTADSFQAFIARYHRQGGQPGGGQPNFGQAAGGAPQGGFRGPGGGQQPGGPFGGQQGGYR